MSLHDFSLKTIEGHELCFDVFEGKKVLLVNTASECGFTPQFATLQEMHQAFGDRLQIIGIPSNDFGGQDPGSNEEIGAFCQKNYGVKFQMMEKVKVIGEDRHPIFEWLTSELGTEVKWNFTKFLIDKNGEVVASVAHDVSPANEQIMNWINE